MLSDTDQRVAKTYAILRGTRAKRTAIVVGKDGKIAHIVKKVNLKQHGIQLVKLLNKLNIEKKPIEGDPAAAKDLSSEAESK